MIAKNHTMREAPELSVVIPVLNEEESVTELADGVRRALEDRLPWELVFVNDGSTDGTVARIRAMAERDPRIRCVKLARRYGQSTAMQAGFDHSRGRVVVTMDGDLQNDPADIPAVLDKLEEGFDLVAGYRVNRQDRFLTRKVPSWIANRIILGLTGVRIRDNGCSLKAYRRELLDRMRLYSDLHRFIPAVAAGTGAARIAEVPVRHHPRIYGRSKYGLSRVGKVIVDLVTILMIRSFRFRPFRLFSLLAAVVAGIGVTFLAIAGIARADLDPVTARALIYPTTALLWFALSAYLMMLGLLAEVAIRERRPTSTVRTPVVREGLPARPGVIG